MRSRNKQGQVTKQLSVLITKELQSMIKDCERKVKIVLRDELEEQHKHDIYESYNPTQISGQRVKHYNETHAHQQKRPYHHSGLLLRSVRGIIDSNVVKIELDDNHYEDGTSVRDVYEWLDEGTSESEYDVYILGGKGSHTPYVGYEPQPRHGFKQTTLDNIEKYINERLIPDVLNGKYLRKTRKGAK